MENQQSGHVINDTPFDPAREQPYRDWREKKLQNYPQKLEQLAVEIDDPMTREAVEALKALLKNESPYHFEGKLAPGQGLICNNVLHTRSGFEDAGEGRLLYRARYYDRIAGT